MKCDHIGCRNEPMRAPRLVVPPTLWLGPDYRSLKMMTTLHYCELHKHELLVPHILDTRIKTDFERLAGKIRPLDFRCDFERARIEFVLVTTPEYRAWMSRINIHELVFAA